MRYLAGIWRLAIAALCFIGTSPAWHAVSLWAFLMYQIGFIAGIVMLWSGCASILRGVQPPALLRGFVLTYAFSLAAVHFFVTPAAEFGVPAQQVIPLSAQVLALIVVGPTTISSSRNSPGAARAWPASRSSPSISPSAWCCACSTVRFLRNRRQSRHPNDCRWADSRGPLLATGYPTPLRARVGVACRSGVRWRQVAADDG